MIFDPNQKNVAHLYLATVHNGSITYKPATMEKSPTPPGQASTHPEPQAPYARIGEDAVEYNGPRPIDKTLYTTKIILFGKQAPALLESSDLRAALTDSRWQVLPIASDQNWGAASTQLVHDLMDEHALAIIALDRDAAHLAEQLALKAFVPVIALSDDRKLTSINVPWIFRLPSSVTAAEAFRLIQSAEAKGANTAAKLRDALASGDSINGFAFLTAGELKNPL